MDFWDTVLGHRLAETLVHTLPELTEKPKQFMVICHSDDEVENEITHQWNCGYRFMNSIVLIDKTILIFEK